MCSNYFEDDFMVPLKQNPANNTVEATYEELTPEEEARLIAESREKYRREMADAFLGGWLEGIIEVGHEFGWSDSEIINTIASKLPCHRDKAEYYFYHYKPDRKNVTT